MSPIPFVFCVSIFASMFQNGESALEMKFAIDLIRDMVHDPVAAYQGVMPGGEEDGDEDEDGFFGGDGMSCPMLSAPFLFTRNHAECVFCILCEDVCR